MNRRGFMGAILAAGVAPAIIRYDALMRPVARDTEILIAQDITMTLRDYRMLAESVVNPWSIAMQALSYTINCDFQNAAGAGTFRSKPR